MTLPDITILISGYNRPVQLQQTIDALRRYLCYLGGNLHWLYGDDSSPDDAVRAVCEREGIRTVSTPGNSGWGANMNNGLAAVETDYVFWLPDHVFLMKPLDLRLGIAVMEQDQTLGLLRYSGTFDGAYAMLGNVDARPYAPNYGGHIHRPGRVYYWTLHPDTFYLYCDWPHLKRRRFHQWHGFYEEGASIHDTEYGFSRRVTTHLQEKPDMGRIAIMADWVDWYWEHSQPFSFQKVEG